MNIQKTIENGPVEIVDFPINSMVDLSIAKCWFTGGYYHMLSLFNKYIKLRWLNLTDTSAKLTLLRVDLLGGMASSWHGLPHFSKLWV